MTKALQQTNWAESAMFLKAIGHPVRLTILEELCKGSKCVLDVQQIVQGVSQPNLSQHLSTLKRSGLIGSHSDGPLRCYYLRYPALVKILLKELKKDHRPKDIPREKIVKEAQDNLQKNRANSKPV